ncbi:MAG TPA: response regulator [Aromatoleum sp.]|uniref:response regulator transcription factor n=1 Tax=Aromatoleum sp. TaxID=2307007 RepID=UPI002B4870C1|nr:response regulator [Aromatoleum sp.]HJV24997.1 response regulator [Aromatoleum sp.]
MEKNDKRCVVYAVDDQPSMLRMLAELLDSVGIRVVAFTSAEEFFEAYVPGPCECLVSDMRMPGMGGLEFQRELKARGHVLPVIFISGFAEVGSAVEAMRQGAFDYLEKPFSHNVFLEKVQRALDKSRAIYEEARKLKTNEARLSLLTPTETRILKLLTTGKSSKEIADVMGISPRTVDNHRGRVMEKLHVHSAVELVLLVTQARSP